MTNYLIDSSEMMASILFELMTHEAITSTFDPTFCTLVFRDFKFKFFCLYPTFVVTHPFFTKWLHRSCINTLSKRIKHV
jgi:hypothetical protein